MAQYFEFPAPGLRLYTNMGTPEKLTKKNLHAIAAAALVDVPLAQPVRLRPRPKPAVDAATVPYLASVHTQPAVAH